MMEVQPTIDVVFAEAVHCRSHNQRPQHHLQHQLLRFRVPVFKMATLAWKTRSVAHPLLAHASTMDHVALVGPSACWYVHDT